MIAQDVPAIVARLQDDLLNPRYAAYMQGLAESYAGEQYSDQWSVMGGRTNRIQTPNPDDGRQFCQATHNTLNITRLFHVSEPMLAVARQAAQPLPGDLRWEEDTFPSRNGIMFYAAPIILLDVWNRPVTVSAVMWVWAPSGAADDPRPGWITTLFSDVTDLRDYYFEKSAKEGLPVADMGVGRYIVFETSMLHQGHPIGPWIEDNNAAVEQFRREKIMRMPEGELPEWDHNGPPSTVNFGRINMAIFLLMQQELADVSDWEDHRLARRNRGKKRPPHAVTVIELRRREQYGQRDEGSGQWLTYRSVTSGHWRRQPYGPRSDPQHKRIWIHPYVRGPDGAPFHQTKRVTTLKR